MSRCLVWLLLVCCHLAAVEAELVLPSPITRGCEEHGRLAVRHTEKAVRKIKLTRIDHVSLAIEPEASVYQNINGVATKYHDARLKADEVGIHIVPPIIVTLDDGEEVRCPAVTVEAIDPLPGGQRSPFATVALPPGPLLVGQQEELQVRIFQLRRDNQLTIPSDWRPALPTGMLRRGEVTRSGSRIYDVAKRQWLVQVHSFPFLVSRPGEYRVGGQLPLGNEHLDMMGNRRFIHEEKIRFKKPATCTVVEPPLAGRPADFAGLVGPVTIRARLERARIPMGDGTLLLVTIASDQIDLIRSPTVPDQEDLAFYPNRERTRDVDGRTREFAFDLVPAKPGKHVIPGISIPWYDASGKAYRHAQGNPVTLQVLPGRRRDLEIIGLTDPGRSSPTPPTTLPPPAHGRGGANPPGSWFVLAFVAGLAGGAGAVLLGRRRRGRRRHRGRDAGRAIRRGDFGTAALLLDALRHDHPDHAEEIGTLRTELEHREFGTHGPTREVNRQPLKRVERLP